MKMIIVRIKGDFFKFNFLIIENKISKAGYQSSNATKYGENS